MKCFEEIIKYLDEYCVKFAICISNPYHSVLSLLDDVLDKYKLITHTCPVLKYSLLLPIL